MTVDEQMLAKVRDAEGFIAALDQSGGSTPKALLLYGVQENEYSGDAEMFDQIHQMRTRIITSPAFNGDRILGAILFEMTMDRQIEGLGTAEYLWQQKQVVPFLKIDKGLEDEVDGSQGLKTIPDLDSLLERARAHGVFGTKERSVIKVANSAGVTANVAQQFDLAKRVLSHDLYPIIEPEVDIHSPSKADAEELLRERILVELDGLADGQQVMLKLTLPEVDGYYSGLVEHPKVLRVVALSGGYPRDEANARLTRNPGVIASFSRALTEGLTAQQDDGEYNSALDAAIGSIFEASRS